MAKQKLSIRDLTSDEQRREGQKCTAAFEDHVKSVPLPLVQDETIKRTWQKAYSLGLVAGLNLRQGKTSE